MKQIPLVFVLYEYVDNGRQEVLFDEIHDKRVVFGTDDGLEEFDDADIEDLGLEALQPGDLVHDILGDCEDPETVGVLLGTLGEKLHDYLPRVI